MSSFSTIVDENVTLRDLTKNTSIKEHLKGVIIGICDIWDTYYNIDNWEPGFMTIIVTWQLIVTLDSICNSCDVYRKILHSHSHCFNFSHVHKSEFLHLPHLSPQLLLTKNCTYNIVRVILRYLVCVKFKLSNCVKGMTNVRFMVGGGGEYVWNLFKNTLHNVWNVIVHLFELFKPCFKSCPSILCGK